VAGHVGDFVNDRQGRIARVGELCRSTVANSQAGRLAADPVTGIVLLLMNPVVGDGECYVSEGRVPWQDGWWWQSVASPICTFLQSHTAIAFMTVNCSRLES
jgi:hypothetical protein